MLLRVRRQFCEGILAQEGSLALLRQASEHFPCGPLLTDGEGLQKRGNPLESISAQHAFSEQSRPSRFSNYGWDRELIRGQRPVADHRSVFFRLADSSILVDSCAAMSVASGHYRARVAAAWKGR